MSIIRSGADSACPDPLVLPLQDYMACATLCDAVLNMDRAANRLRAFAAATGSKKAATLTDQLASEIADMERGLRGQIAMLQGVRDVTPLLAPNLAARKG